MFKLDELVDKLVLNNMCKEEDRDLVKYGLTMGLELIAMIITIIVLGIYFKLIIEGLVFFISFSAIRTYAGGYHTKSGVSCYISSSIIVLVVYFIMKGISLDLIKNIVIVMLLLSIPVILKIAPIPTKNNPIDSIERNYFKKKIMQNLFIECILIIILLLNNKLFFVLSMGLGILLSAILVIIQLIYEKYTDTQKTL